MPYDYIKNDLSLAVTTGAAGEPDYRVAVRPARGPAVNAEGKSVAGPPEIVTYVDGENIRAFSVLEALEDAPDRLRFRTGGNRVVELRPLLLADFREHIRPYMGAVPNIQDERTLRELLLPAGRS